MAQLNKRLKGSSLTETILAMLLLSICSGLGIFTFTKVMDNTALVVQLKAWQAIKEFRYETHLSREYIDKQIQSDELSFSRTIQKTENSNGLYLIKFKALHNNKTICELKEIIAVSNENINSLNP